MLRVLHTADVHLGARHADLGEQAAAQRQRQFAAFRATVDLALAEKVDLVLIAGDLFDSNVQPRRSVELVAAELRRLVDARIRTVLIPGTHDVYDRASIYRSYDLPALAGAVGSDLLTVLTPERDSVVLEAIDVVVHGCVFATKRAPHSPLRDLDVRTDTGRRGTSGSSTGRSRSPARPTATRSSSRPRRSPRLASTTSPSAIGTRRAGAVPVARSTPTRARPEPVALDQDRAGKVLVVTLDERNGAKSVAIDERQVGRTRFEKLELDAAGVGSQPALVELLAARADPDLVLDVRLIGVRPDELDLHVEEVEAAVGGQFLKVRVRDGSVPPCRRAPSRPPDTVLGAFIRDVEAQVAELEAAGDDAWPRELRDALRLGRLLLAGEEVTL